MNVAFPVAVALVTAACGRVGYAPSADDEPTSGSPVSCEYADPEGAVFYVAIDGSDDAAGTSSEPWATINHAVASVPNGATILVGRGEHTGPVLLNDIREPAVTIRSASIYAAQISSTTAAVDCNQCAGYVVEGFEIFKLGSDSNPLVHVDGFANAAQDQGFTLRNNIIHDSLDNAAIRVSGGPEHVTIERNTIYNGYQQLVHVAAARDVVVQDNVLFSGLAEGTGVADQYNYFLWFENTGGQGSTDHVARRNIFLRWEDTAGVGFVALTSAENIVISDNLLVGDSPISQESPLVIRSARNVLVQNNTTIGNLPSSAFAFALLRRSGDDPPNDEIRFHSNIWSDPTGTMGRFTSSPQDDTIGVEGLGNLYWNNGPVMVATTEAFAPADDAQGIFDDPALLNPAPGLGPAWLPVDRQFIGGAANNCELFTSLVGRYAVLRDGSAAAGAANPALSSRRDILGTPRSTTAPSIGAWED